MKTKQLLQDKTRFCWGIALASLAAAVLSASATFGVARSTPVYRVCNFDLVTAISAK